MDSLSRLKARISSLHELGNLVHAMRALAASRVQETLGTLEGIRGYVGIVEEAIASAAALLPERNDLAGPRSSDNSILIVICSEHGFVGGFNEQLLDRATEERKSGQEMIVIGERGWISAKERGLATLRTFPMATHVGGVVSVARNVAKFLASYSTADIAFGRYERGGNFKTEKKSILPLDPALLARSVRWSLPLHHIAPEQLLQELAGEYLFAEITRAAMESLACENGARLRVMNAAERNIDEKLDELGRQQHALRQEAITSELLDVVTGSEALLSASQY